MFLTIITLQSNVIIFVIIDKINMDDVFFKVFDNK